jgi:protein disulfide-isomerase-like protein
MKAQRLIQKITTSRIKLIQTMFNNKNLYRTLMIIGALIIIYLIYKNYLKEGFESSASKFEKDLTNDTKLVLFYADWCGHCKQFKPIWNETADEVNKGGKKIMISVDVGGKDQESSKISEKYGVDGFPTVVIFSNGSKSGMYNGDRTKEGLLAVVA